MLDSHDEVVRKPDHDDVPLGLRLPPSLDPQIQHIMQIDIRQQRRDDSPYAKGNLTFERILKYR